MFTNKEFAEITRAKPFSFLGDTSDGCSESESFLQQEQPRAERRQSSTIWFYFPWVATIVFGSISVVQFLFLLTVKYQTTPTLVSSYEKGWDTDFEPAKTQITVEHIHFTGSPIFDENGTYWIPDPGSIKYIGEPDAEIDKNWDDATWGRYFLVTEDEARQAFSERYGDDVSWLWNDHAGGYVVGIDMFHTLHCLNRLRKAFYPHYYPENDSYRHRVHRGK
ncbi:hypothetical protein JX266_011648 [Neoarthrinium moseri]|nr:hypothetical protein JX266_011648 [Neoarthrinium moseri]